MKMMVRVAALANTIGIHSETLAGSRNSASLICLEKKEEIVIRKRDDHRRALAFSNRSSCQTLMTNCLARHPGEILCYFSIIIRFARRSPPRRHER